MAGISLDTSKFLGGFGPLISLETPFLENTIPFPGDLESTPYFIVFRVNKNINLGASGASITTSPSSMALPIPSNLEVSYNASYNAEAIGASGAIARAAARDFSGTDGPLSVRISNAITEQLSADSIRGGLGAAAAQAAQSELGGIVGGLVGSIGGIGGTLLGAAAGSAATNAVTGALAGAGIARNPHLAQIFTGTSFREHNFQYKLIARNKKESQNLKKIVDKFKFHMAPRYAAAGHFFEYPEEFDIQLRAGKYLFNFLPCVLKNFTVNYTGEGQPVFFEDGAAPYSVTLNMTFAETSVVTKREVSKGA